MNQPKNPKQALAEAVSLEPEQIKLLRDALQQEHDLSSRINQAESFIEGAAAKIESVTEHYGDAAKIAPLTTTKLQADLAERLLEKLRSERDSIRQQLAELFEPAQRAVTRALRLILKAHIDRQASKLRAEYGLPEDAARRAAEDTMGPSQAKQRAQKFEAATRYAAANANKEGVNPGLCDEVLRWWAGAQTENAELGI